MDAFDADVLIYAASPGHPLGEPVRSLLSASDSGDEAGQVGIGSVLLLPEVLSKPMRDGAGVEIAALVAVLGRLTLLPTSREIAELALAMAAHHRLRAADAVHLATAISAGADRFVTNNVKDFSFTIEEIEIVGPERLDS